MKQIILAEDNKDLNKLIGLNLTSYLGIEPIVKANSEDVIELLNILPSIDLIITHSHIGKENTGEIIVNHIRENKLDIPVIILGKTPNNCKDIAISIENPAKWEDVITAAAKSLSIQIDLNTKKINEKYIMIPINYVLDIESSCCDLYLRLKIGANKYNFVKAYNKEEKISRKSLNKYIQKNVKYLYITEDMKEQFTNFISNQLVNKLENLEESEEGNNLDNRIDTIKNSYNVATNEIFSFGFSSSTAQLTESIISSISKTTEKVSNEMSTLIRHLINSSESPLYQDCHMTSIICSEVLYEMGIKDQKVHEKFTFASFFHDIYFSYKPHLSIINNQKELEEEEANLEEKDINLVLNHAKLAANLVLKYPEFPLGADSLIRHHHGSLTGIGFQNPDKADLDEYSRIFLIAREFVNELHRYQRTGKKTKPIIQTLRETHKSPEMISILKILENFLAKQKK